jgi:hypothetical protein
MQEAGDAGWGMRASDMDRESVVAVLRDAHTAGRLTLDEFDERTSAAYASKTWGELEVLTTDLPEEPDLPGPALNARQIMTETRNALRPACTILMCCALLVTLLGALDYGFARLMFSIFT